MAKGLTKKDFDKKQKQISKAKHQLNQMVKNNPKLVSREKDPRVDAMLKLNSMNSLIGFLVRKGHDSGLPMEILIDIANDYEKKIEDLKKND